MGHQPLWPMRMVPLGNVRIAEIDANPALIVKSGSSEGLSARFWHFSEIGVSVSQTVSGRLNPIVRLQHSTPGSPPTVLMPAWLQMDLPGDTHRQALTDCGEGMDRLHPRKAPSNQELRHLAMTGSLHHARSDLQPMPRCESVNLRRVIVGHEEVATKVAAGLEQARMVDFPVSVNPGSRPLSASGVRRIQKERRPRP